MLEAAGNARNGGPLWEAGPRRWNYRPPARVAKRRDHYLYYNGHGDLAAEAGNSATGTATHTYDTFGAPTDSQPADQAVRRYTGRWDKQYDTATTLIQMGARPYDPSLGRFLTVDPIDGGSLNNYDYAGQDPINGYDLAGTVRDAEDSANFSTYRNGVGTVIAGDATRGTGYMTIDSTSPYGMVGTVVWSWSACVVTAFDPELHCTKAPADFNVHGATTHWQKRRAERRPPASTLTTCRWGRASRVGLPVRSPKGPWNPKLASSGNTPR